MYLAYVPDQSTTGLNMLLQ